MNYSNHPVINAVANASTVTSAAVDARFVLMATAQAVFTDGSAAGTLKLQASNDNSAPTNWNDIPLATASVVSGADTMTPVLATPFCYQFIRVSFTSSGGAGTFTVNLHTMGEGA